MLALIGNLGPMETLLVVVVMILVFGGRLPDVAKDAMRMVAKVRRQLDDLKREVNLDGELRRMEREVTRTPPPPPRRIPPPQTVQNEPETPSETDTPPAPTDQDPGHGGGEMRDDDPRATGS